MIYALFVRSSHPDKKHNNLIRDMSYLRIE